MHMHNITMLSIVKYSKVKKSKIKKIKVKKNKQNKIFPQFHNLTFLGIYISGV